ncbi:hypothetical protein RM549_02665 [Salegentibacter sp. F188]|uniref:DUF4843 domain-containing protein n=1 Tax=Autumnicola patrickiae TaxID=3075591 RepID=A0ABU3DY66_9FLAO|nr:hypothetical protein [Salegentibacter sp. F188]MDT0688669.1 hypothetical protein [Salegentibacter sp. F188]
MKKRNAGLLKVLFFCCAMFAYVGCVKDVDFNQANDIVLSPDIQSNLVLYKVEESDFVDPVTKELKTVIRDTVRLEFLDDDYIQNDLNSVEFYFRNINTFPQAFVSRVHFLSASGRKQFSIIYPISPGGSDNPVSTERIEVMGADRIEQVKNSIIMVVELEVQTNQEDFTGDLEFASKGLFKFEF